MHVFHISRKIILYVLLYNLFLWALFAAIYYLDDFQKHFDVPDYWKPSASNAMYFSIAVQSQGFGTNIVPKTDFGRTVVAVQSVLAWGASLVFLVPWLSVTIHPKNV